MTPNADVTKFIQRTPVPSVDYLSPGGPSPLRDVLATGAMRGLIDVLAAEYDRILLIGPSLAHPMEAEILAAYADGVVVTMEQAGGPVPADVRELVESLREGNAPLLGAVVR
jgi:Mrp family chromosome partitioning ATPase